MCMYMNWAIATLRRVLRLQVVYSVSDTRQIVWLWLQFWFFISFCWEMIFQNIWFGYTHQVNHQSGCWNVMIDRAKNCLVPWLEVNFFHFPWMYFFSKALCCHWLSSHYIHRYAISYILYTLNVFVYSPPSIKS